MNQNNHTNALLLALDYYDNGLWAAIYMSVGSKDVHCQYPNPLSQGRDLRASQVKDLYERLVTTWLRSVSEDGAHQRVLMWIILVSKTEAELLT